MSNLKCLRSTITLWLTFHPRSTPAFSTFSRYRLHCRKWKSQRIITDGFHWVQENHNQKWRTFGIKQGEKTLADVMGSDQGRCIPSAVQKVSLLPHEMTLSVGSCFWPLPPTFNQCNLSSNSPQFVISNNTSRGISVNSLSTMIPVTFPHSAGFTFFHGTLLRFTLKVAEVDFGVNQLLSAVWVLGSVCFTSLKRSFLFLNRWLLAR